MPVIDGPAGLGTTVQRLAEQFVSAMSTLLAAVDSTIVAIARLAYVSVLLLGLLLYFTHLEKRLGKDLIKGGVILARVVGVRFPVVVRT